MVLIICLREEGGGSQVLKEDDNKKEVQWMFSFFISIFPDFVTEAGVSNH